jgi:hypothetical protein
VHETETNEAYEVKATVDGCNYYAWTIWRCIAPDEDKATRSKGISPQSWVDNDGVSVRHSPMPISDWLYPPVAICDKIKNDWLPNAPICTYVQPGVDDVNWAKKSPYALTITGIYAFRYCDSFSELKEKCKLDPVCDSEFTGCCSESNDNFRESMEGNYYSIGDISNQCFQSRSCGRKIFGLPFYLAIFLFGGIALCMIGGSCYFFRKQHASKIKNAPVPTPMTQTPLAVTAMSAPVASVSAPAPAPAADPTATILKLKGLLDVGTITQDEFDTQKAVQLAQM